MFDTDRMTYLCIVLCTRVYKTSNSIVLCAFFVLENKFKHKKRNYVKKGCAQNLVCFQKLCELKTKIITQVVCGGNLEEIIHAVPIIFNYNACLSQTLSAFSIFVHIL